jgi:hypothetical protein
VLAVGRGRPAAREPRQRTWVDRRQLWEAPVEDGGHVACGSEVATGGRCQQVAEWVLTSFGREVEQVCPGIIVYLRNYRSDADVRRIDGSTEGVLSRSNIASTGQVSSPKTTDPLAPKLVNWS